MRLKIRRAVRYGRTIYEIEDEKKFLDILIHRERISSEHEYFELEDLELGALITSFADFDQLPINKRNVKETNLGW